MLSDCAWLPAVERSAAMVFRTIPGLSWIVDDAPTSVAEQAEMAEAGTSWVAAHDDEPVGFLCGEILADELHIWELAVALDHQGCGLGRRLMRSATDFARERDLTAVTLTTFRDVPWNAPFYARLGFELLTEDRAGPRLCGLLEAEAERGLPDRCAMRLTIGSGQP